MPLFLCWSNIFRVPYSWWLFQISAQSPPSTFADICVLGSLKIQLWPISGWHSACNHTLTIQSPLHRVPGDLTWARLGCKKILLHSEGWKGRNAPFEIQQRVQNIHAWIRVGFVLIYFPWAELVFRRWLLEPIPAIKACLFRLNETLYRDVKPWLTVSLLNNCLKCFGHVLQGKWIF